MALDDIIRQVSNLAAEAGKREQEKHKILMQNAATARDDQMWNEKLKRIDEQNKQRDAMTDSRLNREAKAVSDDKMLERYQGMNDRYLDAAKIRAGYNLDADGNPIGPDPYLMASGGLPSLGGYGSHPSGKRAPLSGAMEQFKAFAAKMPEGTTPEAVMEAYNKFIATPPDPNAAAGAKDQPGLVKAPITTGSVTGQPGQSGQSGTAPALPPVITDAQAQAYGDRYATNSAANARMRGETPQSGKDMSYQRMVPGMEGEQIAQFKRGDGTAFFANTGAMQRGAPPAAAPTAPALDQTELGREKRRMLPTGSPSLEKSMPAGASSATGPSAAANENELIGYEQVMDPTTGLMTQQEKRRSPPSNFSGANLLQDLMGVERGTSPVGIPSILDHSANAGEISRRAAATSSNMDLQRPSRPAPTGQEKRTLEQGPALVAPPPAGPPLDFGMNGPRDGLPMTSSNFSGPDMRKDLAGVPRGEAWPKMDYPGLASPYLNTWGRDRKKKKKSWFDVPDSSTNPLFPNYRQ